MYIPAYIYIIYTYNIPGMICTLFSSTSTYNMHTAVVLILIVLYCRKGKRKRKEYAKKSYINTSQSIVPVSHISSVLSPPLCCCGVVVVPTNLLSPSSFLSSQSPLFILSHCLAKLTTPRLPICVFPSAGGYEYNHPSDQNPRWTQRLLIPLYVYTPFVPVFISVSITYTTVCSYVPRTILLLL